MSRRAPAARTLIALLSQLASIPTASLFALPACEARATEAEPPPPVIYRWVDENGVPHYTAQRDRIPSAVRGSVREVRPTDAAPPAPIASTPPTTPTPAATPMASSATHDAAPGDAWIGRDTGSSGTAAATAGTAAGTGPALDAFPEPEPPSEEAKLVAPSAVATQSAPASGGASRELDQRIAALEAEIERDEEALKDFLSEAPGEGGASLADRPEFREIALRLPQRQADLRDLRDQRSRLGRP